MRNLIIICVLFSQTVNGQTTDPETADSRNGFRKNVFHINGLYTSVFQHIGAEYERLFYLGNDETVISTGLTTFYSPDFISNEIFAAGPYVRLLFGKKALYFEADGGMYLYYDHTDYIETRQEVEQSGWNFTDTRADYFYYVPRVNPGVRYQNPRKLPVFRIGIGIPHLATASVGIAF